MIKKNDIYRCSLCGNIVEVEYAGGGTLVCCGEAMNKLEELSADTSVEKHVPYLEILPEGVLVKVGQVQEHPMLDAHYIVWIELLTDRSVYRRFLKPGEKPEALFHPGKGETILGAREYCNLHGLWKK